MKTAYLEPSAINWYVDSPYTGYVVSQAMSASGYRPVIGLHTIYELARTFLNPSATQRGRNLFRLMTDLDPSVSPGSSALMIKEVDRLRTRTAVLPFLDHLDQAATRHEMARLAEGVFDHRARQFIEQREAEIKANHPPAMRRYIEDVNELRAADAGAVPRFVLFEDAVTFLGRRVPELIRDLLHGQVSDHEAVLLAKQLDEFPAIRSTVRANLYLMWICVSHGAIPSADKLDDYRHVIEASYCDVLVTNDEQLKRTTPRLHAGMVVLEPLASVPGIDTMAG